MTPAAAIRAALGDEVRECLRVVVTGSREWTAGKPMLTTLLCCRALCDAHLILGHGAARGADELAAHLVQYVFMHQIDGEPVTGQILAFPADWATHGKAAGHIRNQEMLDTVNPDLVLAFPLPSSRGTWDCVRRALAMRVPVVVVGVDGSAEVRRG